MLQSCMGCNTPLPSDFSFQDSSSTSSGGISGAVKVSLAPSVTALLGATRTSADMVVWIRAILQEAGGSLCIEKGMN